MKLLEMLDEIEQTCMSCEECDPTCIANTFKECIRSEVENEKFLSLS